MLGTDIPDDPEQAIRRRDNSSGLAERLLLALLAGFRDGDGDFRCTALGTSSDVAWLRVDNEDGSPAMNLRVTEAYGDAVVTLAELYYECVLHGGDACFAVADS
jgi:hypothetical protein